MKRIVIATHTFCLILLSTIGFAQTANLSIQGVLRTAEGTALDNGEYDLTFSLYTEAKSGAPIWTQAMTGVKIKGGIYSVILGDDDTPLNVPFDQPYFLGVSVEGGEELIPRARLTSSPYALSLIGDDNIFPNSGNVGIGAKSVDATSKLTVKDGNGIIGLEPGTNADFTAKVQSTTNGLHFVNPSGKDFTFAGGNLGIGTPTPTNKLHLKSNGQMMFLQGTDHAYMAFGRNGTSRSAYFGYGGTNTTLTLNNEVGETHIRGSKVRLIPDSGDTGVESDFFVNGIMRVNGTNTRCRLYGTNSAYFGFYPHNNSRKGYLGFTSTSDNLSIVNESNGNIYMKSVGGDIYIDPVSSSKTIFLDGFVRARGSRNISINDYTYLVAGNTDVHYHYGHYTPTNDAYSIEADQGVKAPRFHQKSDRRIKKDFKFSNGKTDLAILNTIEVTDYHHIDEVRDGNTYRKGLIAQQVETVFPQAIEKGKEYIPNIFAFPTALTITDGTAQFNLLKAHDFKIGDKIKILTDKGEEFFSIASVLNEHSFSIKDWKGSHQAKELFIYGKEVHDFRTVDYDRVFTLAVSALQELNRKVEVLENTLSNTRKENQQLKTTLNQKDMKQANLKADMNVLNDRMRKLESLFEATGKK